MSKLRGERIFAVAVAGVLLALLLTGRFSGLGPRPTARSAVRAAGQTRLVGAAGAAAIIPLPGNLAGLVTAGRALWVADGGTVVRIDPATNRIVAAIRVDGGPEAVPAVALAVGDGAVWVADVTRGRVVRIDPGTDRIVAVIPADVVGLVADQYGVWGVGRFGTEPGRWYVVRIDPRTDRVQPLRSPAFSDRPLEPGVGPGPAVVAVGSGSVWVLGTNNDIYRLALPAGHVVWRLPVSRFLPFQGSDIGQVTLGDGSLWVTVPSRGQLVRIAAATGQVLAEIPDDGNSVAVAGDGVWTTCGDADPVCAPYLLRIDPRSDWVVGRYYAYASADDPLAPGPTGVWVASAATGALLHIQPGLVVRWHVHTAPPG